MKALFLTLARVATVTMAWLTRSRNKASTSSIADDERMFDKSLSKAMSQLRSVFSMERVRMPLEKVGLSRQTTFLVFDNVKALILADFTKHPDRRKLDDIAEVILYHLKNREISLRATHTSLEKRACGLCVHEARLIWERKYCHRSPRPTSTRDSALLVV